MPTPLKSQQVQLTHYKWKVTLRNGTFYADGRTGNHVNAGRKSLGTTDYEHALANLREVDRIVHQQLNPTASGSEKPRLDLDQGREAYEKRNGRGKAAGGIKPSSAKRYKPVLDNFIAYAKRNSVFFWDEVTAEVLSSYLDAAERSGKSARTLYTEGTILKQVLIRLISMKLLPRELKIELELERPKGTNRYCPTQAEVSRLCREAKSDPETQWLADVILGLSTTGMRLGELIQLDWSDIEDGPTGGLVIVVRDEGGTRPHGQTKAKSTKNGQTRRVPAQAALETLLKQNRAKPKDLVFRGPGNTALKQDDIRHALTKLAEQVTGTKRSQAPNTLAAITPHSFRHFFVSECCRRGVPEHVLMSWVGHANSTIVRLYFHLRPEASQALMKQLNFGDQGPAWAPSSVVEPLPMVAVTRAEVESMPA